MDDASIHKINTIKQKVVIEKQRKFIISVRLFSTSWITNCQYL